MRKLIRLSQKPLFSVVSSFLLLFVSTIIAVQFVGCVVDEEAYSHVTGECKFNEIVLTLDQNSFDLPVGGTRIIEARVTAISNCVNFLDRIDIGSADNKQLNVPQIEACTSDECVNNMGVCNLVVSVPQNTATGTYLLEVMALACSDWQCDTSSNAYIIASEEIEVNVINDPFNDFSISMPASFGVSQGFDFTVNVDIERYNGHDLDVSLWLEDLPDYVGYSFDPNPVPVGVPSSQLTITADYQAFQGEYYPILAKASDHNVEKHTVFHLSILEPFHLTLIPDMFQISQGQSRTVELHTNRIGIFTFPIMFSAEGDLIGQGIDVTFDPNPVNGESSNVTIDVDNTVPAGSTYTVTIKGIGDQLEKSTYLSVTVLE